MLNQNDPNAKRATWVQALVGRVTGILLKRDAPSLPDTPSEVTTETGLATADHQSLSNNAWKVHSDRRMVYFDLKEMDETDPLIATALDIHADCTVGYEDTEIDGFEWTLEVENDAAKQQLDDLKERLMLGQEVWQIVRDFVRYGEEYREIVLDEQMIVQRFKPLPAYQITPVIDDLGNKQPGWQQQRDGMNYGKPILFDEWQIVPFVAGARRGQFGTGLMFPARRTWKRLSALEDGMVLARMVRAYDKNLHRVPVKPEWGFEQMQAAIKTYRQNMTKRKGLDENGNQTLRENPITVESDFYIPDDGSGKGGIETMAATNAQLQKIDDVRYHQELLLVRLKVPKRYLNVSSTGGALTDGGLSAEDIQYCRTLRQYQAVLRTGVLRLAHVALAVQGFDSKALGVGMNLPKISTQDILQDAQVQLTLAQAAVFFGQVLGALPPDLVADKFMDLSEDEKSALTAFVEKHQQEQDRLAREIAGGGVNPPPPPGGKGGRRPGAPNLKSGVPVNQALHAVARLQMLVQAELEKQGVRFGVGYEERLDDAREVLTDVLLGL